MNNQFQPGDIVTFLVDFDTSDNAAPLTVGGKGVVKRTNRGEVGVSPYSNPATIAVRRRLVADGPYVDVLTYCTHAGNE